MGRFSDMLGKAAGAVQQVNDELQRARQQQQLQQQQHPSQYQWQQQQGHAQTGQSGHHGGYGQQQQTQPYRPPPSPRPSWQQPQSPPIVAPYRTDYDRQMHEAEAELERLKIDSAEQTRQANEQLSKLKLEQEQLMLQAKEEMAKQEFELNQQLSKLSAPPPVPPRPQSQHNYPPPPPRPQSYTTYPPPPPPQPQTHISHPPPPPVPPRVSVRSPSHVSEPAVVSSPVVNTSSDPDREHTNNYAISYPSSPIAAQTTPSMHFSPTPPEVVPSQHQLSPAQQQPPPVPARPQYETPSGQPPLDYVRSESSNTQPRSPTPPPRVSTPEPAKMHVSGITPLAECMSDPVSYEMDWVYHPTVPAFNICGKCYVDHIYGSSFRNYFVKTIYQDSQPRKCFFGTERIKEQLWPRAVATGSLNQLIEFMEKRLPLGDCSQSVIKENEIWYHAPDIPHLLFCKACYEDSFHGTAFGSHFELRQEPISGYCDSSVWLCKYMLELHSKTNNWLAFVEPMRVRVQLPPCPKQTAVPGYERTWYTSLRGPEGLTICAACYYDFFHYTPAQSLFKQASVGAEKMICPLSFLNTAIPAQQAIIRKNHELFWAAVRAVDQQPFCHPDGIDNAVWYTLRNDPAGFSICGGCYGGIVQSVGGTSFFKPHKGRSKNDKWICCFNLNHIRAQAYLMSYAECLAKGTPRPLEQYASMLGDVPLCNKKSFKLGANRRFWGWGVVAICEECYITLAKGSKLEPQFALKGAVSPKERMCDVYSPRMRRIYREACEKNDLAGLLAVGKHRHDVWCKTVPVIENIITQQQIKAMQANMMGIQGVVYKSMGATQDNVMGHTYTVGNSVVGYGYANELSLDGAMYDHKAAALSADVMSGSHLMNINILEQMWREVE